MSGAKNLTIAQLKKLRLNTPSFSQNVYPHYEALRDAGGVLWSESHKSWLISSYDCVKALLLSPNASVEKMSPFVNQATGDVQETMIVMHKVMEHWLPFIDPPEHTRLRLILQRSFAPRALQQHEPMIRATVRKVINGFGDRREIEFLDEFAFQFPALVITDFFGMPSDEVKRIREWSAGIAEFVLGSGKEGRYENSAGMMREMKAFFGDLVATRSSELAAGAQRSEKLLDQLLLTMDSDSGLNSDEIVSTLILILFAAPETTASMLVNSMLALLSNRPQLQQLSDDRNLIGPAMEELIRYDGPVPAVVRVAKEDMEIGGQHIHAGQRIFLLLKSANRDPAQFPNPEVLDFGRGRSGHIGFGMGIHLCLGAPLARMESRIAFEELLAHYEDFELPDQEIVWRHELLAHSPHALRVGLVPRVG
ncbi:hypothetical protein FHS85_004821 [Rhodoligotrophos appendicifer]|uniref:cytochrome P450 n=1 Tax=Rhodoligotrophos appendicifer TaxID=987056 RepID=UPI001185EF2B|nr:cytochrome P450 [Rhodoligotrophos appendicifer]